MAAPTFPPHVVPNQLIESAWGNQTSDALAYLRKAQPWLQSLVRANIQTNPFTIPRDADFTRWWLCSWSWWAWGMNANGTFRVSFKLQGGAELGVFNVPFSASAAPVPTVSVTNSIIYAQPAGAAALNLEAIIVGGTGAWQADGYVTVIGYATGV